MKHPYLMTPGPSPLAPQVKMALGRDIIHHRTDEFRNILKEVNSGLKYIFQTENPVLTFASSGTGAMEAAVSNFLCLQDKVLAVSGGKFGERWAEICRAYNLDVSVLEVEWGKSPDLEDIKEILDKNKDIKAVYTTLCETSTATVYDIEGIAGIVSNYPAILVVDAISGLGSDVLRTDEWGVDVVVSGSQKGFMLPPGLAFMSVSKKALSLAAKASLPKYYFDVQKSLKSYEKNDTPYTPAVSLITALKESLDLIKQESIEVRWKEFSRIARALRLSLEEMGLAVFSSSPSSAVTAASLEGAKAVVAKLRKEYGLSIAAGQGKVADKIIRIAHMGYINAQDVAAALFLLEEALKKTGYKIKQGAALKKFQEEYYV